MPTLPELRIVSASVAPLFPTRKCMSAPAAPTPEVVCKERSAVVAVPPMSFWASLKVRLPVIVPPARGR